MLKIAFWSSVVGGCYSYFIYPLLLLLWPGRSRDAPISGANPLPKITLIITVHNEQERIEEKLRNSLASDYPTEKLEILVASDCSTDQTDKIVGTFGAHGVRLVRSDEHKGKEYAQWLAIQEAGGEILVFSDAATRITTEGLRLIGEKFADSTLGALSSEDRFVSDDGTVAGEGAYVRYEMWLRRLESRHAGLVGLSGSFFAARSAICRPWDVASPSDFNTALNCSRHGKRSISCPDVVGYYKDIKDPQREYQRKVRTVLRGLAAIARQKDVLNPFKLGMFSFQVWSHKVMRWAVPWFLLLALLTNMALFSVHWLYQATLACQIFGYGLAIAAHVVLAMRSSAPIRLIYFFVQANVAIVHATFAFLAGKRIVVWSPSKR